MNELHLLKLAHVPILDQLRYEEALLRIDNRNWCIINQGSPPAIVMGISGKPAELINADRYRQNPVPLIRRFSGGGTVFVDEQTLFITFICNTDFVPVSPFPEPIMRWTEQLYQPLFDPHPFSLRENDYVIGHQKVGGNAQSITKNRWLHHTSLLWNYSSERMDYLLMPSKTPEYRKKRSHDEFLGRLADYFPCANQFQDDLTEHLNGHFSLKMMDLEEVEKIKSLPHRKATVVEKHR